MNNNTISVVFADSSHAHYAPRICDLIYESALQRGTGIAKRSPEYIAAKMTGGKAVVALDGEKLDRKSTRLNSSHTDISRMPSSA